MRVREKESVSLQQIKGGVSRLACEDAHARPATGRCLASLARCPRDTMSYSLGAVWDFGLHPADSETGRPLGIRRMQSDVTERAW